MKRSGIKRKSPLKAGVSLKRTGKLKPGRKVKRRDTFEERLAFRDAIDNKVCAICGRTPVEAFLATGHALEAHHAVSQQALKKRGLHAHLWDPRNAVPLCAEPCHRRMTSCKRPLTWDELPDAAKDFADSLGLIDFLARVYPRAEA